jgi:hypothetical protein
MKAEAEKASAEEGSAMAINSGSTATKAGAETGDAATTAGSGVLAVQQFV